MYLYVHFDIICTNKNNIENLHCLVVYLSKPSYMQRLTCQNDLPCLLFKKNTDGVPGESKFLIDFCTVLY